MKVVFLKLMFNTKIKLPEIHNGIRLLQKRKQIYIQLITYMIKTNMSFT